MASEIAQLIPRAIVLRHDAPCVLVTDRGKAFTAQLAYDILQLSHTAHRTTTAYHPQTNGLIERLNKTLADMISMYVDVEHKTWDQILPYVTFACNTATQETTRFTPFRLVYGREVQMMLDAMLPCADDEITPDAASFVQEAEQARHLARLHIKRQHATDSQRYNLRHRKVTYNQVDQVWVWTPVRKKGLSKKLLHRYFGPYKVLHRVENVDYEVIPDGTVAVGHRQPQTDIVHVVCLKLYFSRDCSALHTVF